MSISYEILDWSQKKERPLWQRDALRRFITSQGFSPTDEAEVLTILKAEHGLSVPKPVTAYPLEERHLPADAAAGGPVQLASVGEVENANRLAGGQTLRFAVDGLTVVYGDNGSGKSGYVRMLKRACRTRQAESVLPDVFKAPAGTQPSALIRYRLSPTDAVAEERWVNGSEFAPALSQISVFDSRVATITVDEANELTFLPFGLDALEKLGALCGQLKERLTDERNKLGQRLVDVRQGFGSDKDVVGALDKLTAKTSDDELGTLSAWSDVDEERHNAVAVMLSDPENQAKTLRARKLRCETALNRVKAAAVALSDEALIALRQKADALAVAKEAVRLHSAKDFAREPLPGVGSDAWRMMYEAARKFSLEHAYVGRDFPASEPGDYCVLCHQPLADEARERFQRFEAFVKAEVEATALAATESYSTAVAVIQAGGANLPVAIQDLAAMDAADSEWAAGLTSIAQALSARAKAALEACVSAAWEAVPSAPVFDIGAWAGHALALESHAQAHDAALAPEKKAELTAERSRLKARKAFSANKTALISLRDLLRHDSAYDKCLKAVMPTAITAKKKDLDEAHVQAALKAKLDEEKLALRLSSIPVGLDFQTKKAKTSHRMQLDGVTMRETVGKVISEGEYRALALACFLAQVRQQSDTAGIVVDDPVSSLDHDRRELVAERLVREAKTRQVIVFTHDLVFFFLLRAKAGELQAKFEARNLYRGAVGFGTVEEEDPWKAKSLPQRLEHLESQMLKKLRQLHAEMSPDYALHAREFCDLLRESWERLVEEGLFNRVVTRFLPGVQTQRLDEIEFNEDSLDHIWRGMTKISNWTAHDPSIAKNAVMPPPDEFKQHLQSLSECWNLLTKGGVREKARQKRQARREPPKATVL